MQAPYANEATRNAHAARYTKSLVAAQKAGYPSLEEVGWDFPLEVRLWAVQKPTFGKQLKLPADVVLRWIAELQLDEAETKLNAMVDGDERQAQEQTVKEFEDSCVGLMMRFVEAADPADTRALAQLLDTAYTLGQQKRLLKIARAVFATILPRLFPPANRDPYRLFQDGVEARILYEAMCANPTAETRLAYKAFIEPMADALHAAVVRAKKFSPLRVHTPLVQHHVVCILQCKLARDLKASRLNARSIAKRLHAEAAKINRSMDPDYREERQIDLLRALRLSLLRRKKYAKPSIHGVRQVSQANSSKVIQSLSQEQVILWDKSFLQIVGKAFKFLPGKILAGSIVKENRNGLLAKDYKPLVRVPDGLRSRVYTLLQKMPKGSAKHVLDMYGDDLVKIAMESGDQVGAAILEFTQATGL